MLLASSAVVEACRAAGTARRAHMKAERADAPARIDRMAPASSTVNDAARIDLMVQSPARGAGGRISSAPSFLQPRNWSTMRRARPKRHPDDFRFEPVATAHGRGATSDVNWQRIERTDPCALATSADPRVLRPYLADVACGNATLDRDRPADGSATAELVKALRVLQYSAQYLCTASRAA